MSGRNLTVGPVGSHLLTLTAPMVLGVFAIMSVGFADAYFVGKIGEVELAAISFIFPVTTALTSLGIGLSAGATAVVSQALGAGKANMARRLAAHAFAISAGLGICTALAGFILIDALFQLLQAQPEVMPSIRAYLSVWFYGFPLLVLLLVSNALMRAHGNAVVPAVQMTANAILNIALNPVLIFGLGPVPALGIAGAALATVLAFSVTLTGTLWPVFRTFAVVQLSNFSERGYAASARHIGAIGAPAAMANAINPAGLAVITAIVATFGPATVAGFGAAGRVEALAVVPMLALSGSIGAIIGQNWGAKKYQRAARALKLSGYFCLAYGVVIAAILNLFAESIARQFSDSADVYAQTVLYLRIVSWSFFAYGFLIVCNACLNARSKAVPSMLLSITRIGLLYIPLAALGGSLLDQAGVYLGATTANLVAGLAALAMATRFGLWRWRSGDTD